MLEFLAPLDYPRQAAAGLARGAYRLGTGSGTWEDALGMVPGALGLAASVPLGPLGGAVAGGLAQGLGRLTGSEAFDAPTAQDVVSAAGGNPDSWWQTMGASYLTDPLTYTSVPALLGSARARPKAPAGGLATELTAPVHAMPGVIPEPPNLPNMHTPMRPARPSGPAFGTPEYYAQVQAAIEADAAAQAAREASSAVDVGASLTPVAPNIDEAMRLGMARGGAVPVSPDEMSRWLEGRYGVFGDLREDLLAGPRTAGMNLERSALLDELLRGENAYRQSLDPAMWLGQGDNALMRMDAPELLRELSAEGGLRGAWARQALAGGRRFSPGQNDALAWAFPEESLSRLAWETVPGGKPAAEASALNLGGMIGMAERNPTELQALVRARSATPLHPPYLGIPESYLRTPAGRLLASKSDLRPASEFPEIASALQAQGYPASAGDILAAHRPHHARSAWAVLDAIGDRTANMDAVRSVWPGLGDELGAVFGHGTERAPHMLARFPGRGPQLREMLPPNVVSAGSQMPPGDFGDAVANAMLRSLYGF